MKRIPESVSFLTMAVIRRGKNRKRRLEALVMGHYKDPQGHSCIDHQVFYGPTDDPFAGAWEKLDEWGKETGLLFTRTDGIKLKVQIAGILETGSAAEFCESWINTYIMRPADYLRSSQSETGFLKFRYSKNAIEFSTGYYENLTKRNTEKINPYHDYLKPYTVISPWALMLNYCLADFYLWQQTQKQQQPKAPSMKTTYKECSLNLNFTDVDLQVNNRSEALTLLEDLIYADSVINDRIALEALKDAIEREVILS